MMIKGAFKIKVRQSGCCSLKITVLKCLVNANCCSFEVMLI